jgi:hypothetical protein
MFTGEQLRGIKLEKLEIEGIELKDKEEQTEESESDSDNKLWDMVDIELTREVEKKMQGVYEEEFVYNIPYYASADKGGKVNWGILCDKVNCKYRRENKPHTHVLGVNVNGAEQLIRTYKHIKFESEEPKIMDIEGKAYWMLKITITNVKDNIVKPLWIVQAVMQSDYKTGKFTFNENALAIAQSKGYRNLILSVVPSNAKVKWIKEYSEGKAYTKPDALIDESGKGDPEQSQEQSGELISQEQIESLKALMVEKVYPFNKVVMAVKRNIGQLSELTRAEYGKIVADWS